MSDDKCGERTGVLALLVPACVGGLGRFVDVVFGCGEVDTSRFVTHEWGHPNQS